MNLAIIGTGNNSRIKTEGLNGSKHLIKIKGECLPERTIRIGRTSGITKVFYIINSHEPELKQKLLTTNFKLPLKIIEQKTEDFIYGLMALAPFFSKEPFFLINKDSVFIESELAEFVTYSLMQEDVDGILAVTRYNDNEKPFCVAMNDEDIILKFSDVKYGYSWATGGIYYFTPKIFNEMKYALDTGIAGAEKFLQFLIVRGYILKGFLFSKIINVNNAGDIDKADDLISGEKVFEI